MRKLAPCNKTDVIIIPIFIFQRSEKEKMKIPFDIEDAKQLGLVLDRYKDLYYFEVMTGICLLYLL